MVLVEVFEASVMHGHILYLETSLCEILRSPVSCLVIIKEGTDGENICIMEIANTPCHIAYGVHHKTVVDNFFFH